MMKRILERTLRVMALILVRKYRPLIVGITGSVGKSSTKEAVGLVLSRKYRVRVAQGNYNNEFGIPLSVIGAKSGGHSVISWFLVGAKWLAYLLLPLRYPEILVLEMGIDRPGDMEYLLSIVPVDIGIFTQVSGSHVAHFGSVGNIAREKGKMIASLPGSGFAILNADDDRVIRFREKTKAKTITFSVEKEADVRAEHIALEPEARLVKGISFKMNYHGKSLPVRLPKVVARHHIPAVLAAAAAGVALKVNLVEIVDALAAFEPLPGRMRLLPGVRGSILLDDTYNASPVSMIAALSVLGELRADRKIAVLGDMLELGDGADAQHQELMSAILSSGVQVAVLVGNHMRSLHQALVRDGGWSGKQTIWFERSDEAAPFVAEIAKEGDLVLVKGSRGMRMEWVSEKLLFDPNEAAYFLCCQSAGWRKQVFLPPEEWNIGK